MIYLFDSTLGGFLTTVFTAFERKEWKVRLQSSTSCNTNMFEEIRQIETETEKAKRVFVKLKTIVGNNVAQSFLKIILSEDSLATQYAFEIVVEIFKGNVDILENYGDPRVLYFCQTLTKVSRERHRMQAFIRFEKSSDGLFFCLIAPDFNVLPLIIHFFKKRYADQPWLIYDEKRNYGMHYDLHTITEVQLNAPDQQSLIAPENIIAIDVEELKYQQLWKSYFKSTNIPARKNMKLHLRHVPKRYWRYLTEKQ